MVVQFDTLPALDDEPPCVKLIVAFEKGLDPVSKWVSGRIALEEILRSGPGPRRDPDGTGRDTLALALDGGREKRILLVRVRIAKPSHPRGFGHEVSYSELESGGRFIEPLLQRKPVVRIGAEDQILDIGFQLAPKVGRMPRYDDDVTFRHPPRDTAIDARTSR